MSCGSFYTPGGGGGRGFSKKVDREALPRGATSYPYTEKVPLLYTSYWKMVSLSHTYSRTLHPFQLLQMHCFYNMNKSQNQNVFLTFSQPLNASVSHFWVFLLSEMTDFLPFYLLEQVKSLPFKKPEAWKKCPFRGEPFLSCHCREYPPPSGLYATGEDDIRDLLSYRMEAWGFNIFHAIWSFKAEFSE